MIAFLQHAIILFTAFIIRFDNRTAMASVLNKEDNSFNEIQGDTSALIANGATLQRVSNQFGFTEGPAVDKQGNIFFTDQPNDQIWTYGVDGSLSLFLNETGRANGLYVDNAGNIIACADAKGEVWRITPKKKVTVLYKAPKSKRLNGPNDVWIDAKGGIYITDPYYQRPYWKHKLPKRNHQNVYYLPSGKKTVIAVDTALKQPNGLVGSPDGKWLFVSDIGDGKIYKYGIETNGSLTNRVLFAEVSCDGMTLDSQGNLYAAGNGVTVYNSSGTQVEHISVPARWTSNVCFGGKERNNLFITASEAVYTLQMQVKGVE